METLLALLAGSGGFTRRLRSAAEGFRLQYRSAYIAGSSAGSTGTSSAVFKVGKVFAYGNNLAPTIELAIETARASICSKDSRIWAIRSASRRTRISRELLAQRRLSLLMGLRGFPRSVTEERRLDLQHRLEHTSLWILRTW